jgi:hypothetical protein
VHRILLAIASTAAIALALSAAAAAVPIPGGATSGSLEKFSGAPATPHPVSAPDPPRHPHMAPNGRSNIHDDAYQTDTYQGVGPLGKGITASSSQNSGECASITFDSKNRIVSVCVGAAGPTLQMIDPATLDRIALFPLPPRSAGSAGLGLFQNFTGGGYFYLDDKDRAVLATTTRHVYVVRETDGPGFALDRDYDLTTAVPSDDAIISALPDWSGRLWFASKNGVVGWIDPESGAVHARALGEPIGNSFAIDETGGVYIVSDAALYRFDAGPDGPVTTWRETYDNIGVVKPGQTEKGSGTTPTLMGRDLVSITDNADPMNVVVYKRAAQVDGSRLVCKQPVFGKGASNTDQSLIGTPTSMVVENNYGYSGPTATENGATTTPGLTRVDLDPAGGCHVAWTSKEIAPSVVPKLSLGNGLVYTYTKPARTDGADPWYFTALDFATGRTVYKALVGEGLGYNNNYAPVTIGPDGSAFVGTLGGITSVRDATPPQGGSSRSAFPVVHVRQRCVRGHRVRIRVTATGLTAIDAWRRGAKRRADLRRPFVVTLPGARRTTRLRIRATVGAGVRVTDRRPLRRCYRHRLATI